MEKETKNPQSFISTILQHADELWELYQLVTQGLQSERSMIEQLQNDKQTFSKKLKQSTEINQQLIDELTTLKSQTKHQQDVVKDFDSLKVIHAKLLFEHQQLKSKHILLEEDYEATQARLGSQLIKGRQSSIKQGQLEKQVDKLSSQLVKIRRQLESCNCSKQLDSFHRTSKRCKTSSSPPPKMLLSIADEENN